MFVQTSSDDDFIGFAFAYQGARRFYLVSWKQTNQGYWRRHSSHSLYATAGIEIKVCMGVLMGVRMGHSVLGDYLLGGTFIIKKNAPFRPPTGARSGLKKYVNIVISRFHAPKM